MKQLIIIILLLSFGAAVDAGDNKKPWERAKNIIKDGANEAGDISRMDREKFANTYFNVDGNAETRTERRLRRGGATTQRACTPGLVGEGEYYDARKGENVKSTGFLYECNGANANARSQADAERLERCRAEHQGHPDAGTACWKWE